MQFANQTEKGFWYIWKKYNTLNIKYHIMPENMIFSTNFGVWTENTKKNIFRIGEI